MADPTDSSVASVLHLEQLLSRATAARTRIDEFHRRLASTPPGATAWPEVLSMYSVLNAQLSSLSAELRPEARHYALHPQASALLGESAPWWRENALPAMHSVRLEPAQEAEAAELLSRAPPSSLPPQQQLQQLQRRVDARNVALRRSVEALSERRARQPVARQGGVGGAQKAAPVSAEAARLLAAAQWGIGLSKRLAY